LRRILKILFEYGRLSRIYRPSKTRLTATASSITVTRHSFLAIAYRGFQPIVAVWLKASKRHRRTGLRDLVEYPLKSLIFVLALMLGRICGFITYRKLVL
jgi:hypothetical protein